MATKHWGCHDGCDEEDKAELRKTVKIKIQESLKKIVARQSAMLTLI